MRGDLEQQFNRAQMSGGDDNTSQKVIVGAGLFILVCFIISIIAITVFVARTLDKFIDAEPATKIDPNSTSGMSELASQMDRLSGGTGSNSSGRSSDGTGSSVRTGATDPNFTFGTISGTAYYSAYSNISFTAPKGWMLTSYAKSTASSSPRDMTASSGDMSASVIIQYESMKNNNYHTAEDGLSTSKVVANSQNYQMVDSKTTAKWGGNKFTGIIYKTTAMNYSTYYEVLVAEVNGYVLKISITAGSEQGLATVRGYFK